MHRHHPVPVQRQRGEINLPRLFTICAIFVAILLLPLYFLKDKGKAAQSRAAAAASAASAPTRP